MTLATIAAKIIIKPVKLAVWIWLSIDNLIIRFHGRPAALKRAVKRATKLHKKTGKRYRVFFLARRYRVFTRRDIKDQKKAGVFNHYINSSRLEGLKFFDTNVLQPCTSK
jgi:hypothetical protein